MSLDQECCEKLVAVETVKLSFKKWQYCSIAIHLFLLLPSPTQELVGGSEKCPLHCVLLSPLHLEWLVLLGFFKWQLRTDNRTTAMLN